MVRPVVSSASTAPPRQPLNVRSRTTRLPSNKIVVVQCIIALLSIIFVCTLLTITISTKQQRANHNNLDPSAGNMRRFKSDERTIQYAVMGGTGMQGGAAIDYILSTGVHPSSIRTLTRNKNSSAAKQLAAKGVIVMEGKQDIGDIENDDGVEECKASYIRLFDGVDCIFAITFTQYDSGIKEQRLGEMLFEVIAQSPTVKQVVFSGGERTGIRLLDAKANIESTGREILRNKGIRCVFLHTSFFMENVLVKGQHKRFRKLSSDGKYELSLPLPYDRKIAMISARDIGTCAGRILVQRPFPDAKPYKEFNIVGDLVSPQIFLDAAKGLLPEYDFTYRQTQFEELKKAMGEQQANLVNQIYEVYYEQNSDEGNARKRMESTKQLNPSTKDIRAWIETYAKQVLEQ